MVDPDESRYFGLEGRAVSSDEQLFEEVETAVERDERD
jgi:hypothetical protein